MLNRNFKKEWKLFNGEIMIWMANHFELAFDKEYIGIGLEISYSYRTLYLKLLNLVIRIY